MVDKKKRTYENRSYLEIDPQYSNEFDYSLNSEVTQLSYDFPLLKLRSRSVIFAFEFDRVVIQNSLVADRDENEKIARTPVMQNFSDYVKSINNVGIPIAVFVGYHASKLKAIIDKILKKARIFFLEFHYLPENKPEDPEAYQEFKQSVLEKMSTEYEMVYYFDADAEFITKLDENIKNREQFELFKVEQ
jgi:hypothetical protein